MKYAALLMAVCAAAPVMAQPTIRDIMLKLEERQKMTGDVRANVTLTQQKAGQGVKKTDMEYYRRDKDDAFMIVMTAPESEKGNGYLRVDENFWMYRKNTRTFQHINRDESIGGSDAKADDFETRTLTERYEGAKDSSGKEVLSEEKLGAVAVWKFEIKAKVNDVDYPRKIYWVSKDNYLELKEQAYASSGTLMQSAYFPKYTIVDGKYVPVNQMFVDEFEKGNKTLVEISNISTATLNDQIFTKAYLENLSK